jgi:hypothetical protein
MLEQPVADLADLTQAAPCVFITGFFVGGALLLWIDHALRRRTQEMGLILATIGLATLVVGLGIYFFPLPTQSQSAANAAGADRREPEPIVWSKTPILGWTKAPDGTIYTHTFGIAGKNVGKDEVQLERLYIESGLTGARVELKVQIPNEGAVAARDTNPIPADAFIELVSDEFAPTIGVAESEFLRDWGAVRFVAEYDGQKHRMIFDRATIDALFDAQRPKSEPHVSRKSPGTSQVMQTAAAAAPVLVTAPPPPPAAAPQPAPIAAPPPEAVAAQPPTAATIMSRRELLLAYADTINGPLAAAIHKGREICENWNALGGSSVRQLYDQVGDFRIAATEAFARMEEFRRKDPRQDDALAGLNDWTFEPTIESTARLQRSLPPLFLLDERSIREALLNDGAFVDWAVALGKLDHWIATKRKLLADELKNDPAMEGRSSAPSEAQAQ